MGNYPLQLNGKKHVFPAVTRKKTRSIIYRDYYLNRQIPAKHKLKRTSFYKLTAKLTHSDPKLRKAMDYVTGFLINDYFNNVENIILHFVKTSTAKKDWIKNMELVGRYLKYDFEKGISNQQKCPARGLAFGLGIGSDNNLVGKTKQMCGECKFLQYFFNRLNNIILSSPQDNESALTALRGAHEKAILYMGHLLRVLNQQMAIEKKHLIQ